MPSITEMWTPRIARFSIALDTCFVGSLFGCSGSLRNGSWSGFGRAGNGSEFPAPRGLHPVGSRQLDRLLRFGNRKIPGLWLIGLCQRNIRIRYGTEAGGCVIAMTGIGRVAAEAFNCFIAVMPSMPESCISMRMRAGFLPSAFLTPPPYRFMIYR